MVLGDDAKKSPHSLPLQMLPAENESLNSKSRAVLSEVEDTMTNRMAPSSARLLRWPTIHPVPLTSHILCISLRSAILFQFFFFFSPETTLFRLLIG